MAETPATPNPAPQAKVQPQLNAQRINFPKVDLSAVDGFLKVYNQGGLMLLFDGVSRKAMMDFANTVLRSFVIDQMQKAIQRSIKKNPSTPLSGQAVAKEIIANTPVATAPSPNGKIILTD